MLFTFVPSKALLSSISLFYFLFSSSLFQGEGRVLGKDMGRVVSRLIQFVFVAHSQQGQGKGRGRD